MVLWGCTGFSIRLHELIWIISYSNYEWNSSWLSCPKVAFQWIQPAGWNLPMVKDLLHYCIHGSPKKPMAPIRWGLLYFSTEWDYLNLAMWDSLYFFFSMKICCINSLNDHRAKVRGLCWTTEWRIDAVSTSRLERIKGRNCTWKHGILEKLLVILMVFSSWKPQQFFL